jgi:cobalt-zinc-cadmium efflux system outer membrane protein
VISNFSIARNVGMRRLFMSLLSACLFLTILPKGGAAEETLLLDTLVTEGLARNPEVLAARAKAEAAGYRIPQAKSLPDPMFSPGYQNVGFDKITFGQEQMSHVIFNASQKFYFPGKRGLRGEIASSEAESLGASYNATKSKVAAQIETLFYDLFLAYKTIDILEDRTDLFTRIEDAAQARYSSGRGSQQEVIMAQTEKYMILEKEEMQKQRVQALQGMLNSAVGRTADAPLGRPVPPAYTPYTSTLEEALSAAEEGSPEIDSRRKMVGGAEAKVKLANKEYYPDVTVGATYFMKGGGFVDWWALTFAVNLPVFYKSKQQQALYEAQSGLSQVKRELSAAELRISSAIRENHSMVRSADNLMKLYKEGLIPKTDQDVQLAFSNYVTGKTDALTVITRIKNLLDYDQQYWVQFAAREKAIARLDELSGSIKEAVPNQTGNSARRGETE